MVRATIESRRADELISIAEGRTSLVEVREGYKRANAKRNTGHVHAQSAEIPEQEPTPRPAVACDRPATQILRERSYAGAIYLWKGSEPRCVKR
jgi:hypothetical protein